MSTYQLNYTGEEISGILKKANNTYTMEDVTLESEIREYAKSGLSATEIILYLEGTFAPASGENLWIYINGIHVMSIWYKQASTFGKVEARILCCDDKAYISSIGASGQWDISLSPTYDTLVEDTAKTKSESFKVMPQTSNLSAGFKVKLIYK